MVPGIRKVDLEILKLTFDCEEGTLHLRPKGRSKAFDCEEG